MKTIRYALLAAIFLTTGLVGSAGARIVGGSPTAGCLVTFEGIDPSATSPNRAECKDGDACDADGQVNGSCTFSVSVCGFQTDVTGCTPTPVTKISGNAAKLGLTLPPVPISAPVCAAASSVVVPIHGKKKSGKKVVKVKAIGTKPQKDKNKISLVCLKASGPPNPGLECPNNPAGGPRQLTYTITDHGTDLDTGFSGVSHNFPVINGATVRMCLTECDGTTNPNCKASGPTGQGTFNGLTLGPPLPLFAAGTPVCVRNDYLSGETLQGNANVQTGEFDASATPIALNSVVFSTSTNKVCPECISGTCDSGPGKATPCTVDGTVTVINPSQHVNKKYNLSSKCPPGAEQGSMTGTIPIKLPITTGTSMISGSKPCPGQPRDDSCATFSSTCSVNCAATADFKGGINQWCCGDPSSTPCFPTAANSGEPNHAIVRTGSPVVSTPAWPDPTYPKTAMDSAQVATFCIASSGSSTIDQVAGLPGPGALIFNGTVVLDANK